MLAHRLTDLCARGLGQLSFERTRLEACLEDAFDGARLVSLIAHRMLERCEDIFSRPGELQCKQMLELRAGVALAGAQALSEARGHLAPAGKPFHQEREVIAAPLAGFSLHPARPIG